MRECAKKLRGYHPSRGNLSTVCSQPSTLLFTIYTFGLMDLLLTNKEAVPPD